MPDQICPQCHNTILYFDQDKHSITCEVCGWDQNHSERVNEMFAYDQHRQKAIAFIKARDYNSAKPFLEKMRNTKPDDSDIYYLHLMGLTECCQNLLLNPGDSNRYALVKNYWSTFCYLQGDQSRFLQYFKRREAEAKRLYDKKLFKSVLALLLCYIPLIVFSAIAFNGNYWCLIPTVIMIIVILYLRPLSSLFKLIQKK